jgi:hypothetical protein
MSLKPQTRAVLGILREQPDGVTPIEALHRVGTFRLAARVSELREAGFDVVCERVEGSVFRYRLVEQPRQLEAGL